MIDAYVFDKTVKHIAGKDFAKNFGKTTKIWIDLCKPSPDEIALVSKLARLNPITQEDIQMNHHRVKYEEFNEYTFIVFNGILEIKKDKVKFYSVFFAIGKNFVISSHMEDNDVISRLKGSKVKMSGFLKKDISYILHYMLDQEMDKYYPIVEDLFEEIEILDDRISKESKGISLDMIFDKKRVAMELKKSVSPSIDVFARLVKMSDNFVKNDVVIYFRDVYDHAVRINHILEKCQDQISSTVSENLAAASNKMNEIMRVLTLITTFMLPLSVISGIYGMNIPLPWQQERYSILIVLGIMGIVTMLMLLFFRKKKWL